MEYFTFLAPSIAHASLGYVLNFHWSYIPHVIDSYVPQMFSYASGNFNLPTVDLFPVLMTLIHPLDNLSRPWQFQFIYL